MKLVGLFIFLLSPAWALECIENLAERCMNSSRNIHTKTSSYEFFKKDRDFAPYAHSLTLNLDERYEGYSKQLINVEVHYYDYFKKTPGMEAILKNCVSKDVTYSLSIVTQGRISRCIPLKDNKTAARLSPLACPGIDCPKAFSSLLKTMSPCESPDFEGVLSTPQLVEKIATDEEYRKPICQLALTVMKRVEEAKEKNLPYYGDLWQDTMDAITATTRVNTKERREMALEIMGLIGTRGPSMHPLYKMATTENIDVMGALGVIASGASYLDMPSRAAGKAYSLPNQVETTCDYTRPYHFWLSAYLASTLKQEGYSDEATLNAIHTSGKLYEMLAETGTNEENEHLGKGNVDPDVLLETQKDIVFNDTGAVWGIRASERDVNMVTISVDEALSDVVIKSDPELSAHKTLWEDVVKIFIGKVTSKQLNPYEWEKHVAPDAHLPRLKKILDQYEEKRKERAR